MKRSTSVRHHSRRGTRGVRRHTREFDSPEANCVPHDSLEEEEESEEEDDEAEENQILLTPLEDLS